MRSFLSGYLIVDLPSHLALSSISKFHKSAMRCVLKQTRNFHESLLGRMAQPEEIGCTFPGQKGNHA
jgi:hypothetical protein